MSSTTLRCGLLVILMAAGFARADSDRGRDPYSFSNNTKYLALGDSLAAGFGALPATRGYAYLLYLKGVYDKEINTSFANAAVPGATSSDVLTYQVPQAIGIFRPHVITISVGGNDLLKILGGADPVQVLTEFQGNLTQILCGLRQSLPQTRVYIHNLYDIPEITEGIPGGLQAILQFNAIVAGVAQACGAAGVADVYSAFLGRQGLLIIDRKRHEPFEVHPTNAGYRVIADAFEAVH
jgi:lysophospholipase L1-like esterase